MPIIDQQRRLAEKGRIRLGEKKVSSKGTSYPAKLDRLRFTSRDHAVIDRLAILYGGDVEAWEGQWQVIAGTREIAVMLIPSAMGFSQWFEDWTGAVCQKRCDGVTDHVRDVPCDCDPDNRKCKTTTRLSVILPDLPGLGVWRLETHGYYASVEIAAAVEMVELAAGAGAMLPARLRLEDRTVKRLIDGKVETRNFVVPVLDLDVTARQLMAINGGASAPPAVGAGGGPLPLEDGQGGNPPATPPAGETPVGAPTPPAPSSSWKPVDRAALPAAPFVSVKDQMAEVHRERKPRKNAAAPIKPTGMKPRTADAIVCHLCGEEYGDATLKRNPSSEGGRWVHRTCADAMSEPAKAEGASQPSEGAGGQDTGVGDRDGTSGGVRATEPVPAAPPAPDNLSMSASQNGLLMKLCAQAFPVDTKKMSGAEADEHRRNASIALARQLGWEISSRRDLTKESASVMIDALKGIVEGTYRWHEDELIEAATGDRVMVVSS